jgi:predicted negative regulator of RcsB-dependent stress response
MLETVRDFSAAQRRPEDAVTERFLAWARGFGAAHHQAVFGADLVASVELIRSEHDNLLHALQLALKLDDASTAAAITAVLAGLWTIESDFMRLSSLGREVAWLLSHHRPEPDAVAVTRTAVVSILINAMLIRGPGAGRAMVALRRLPPADPVTLSGAAEAVLRAPDQAAIEAFCDSDRPMLSGVANGVMSYARAAEDDLEGALQAAERLLAAVHSSENRWLIAVANSRVAELHLEMDRADGARKHMLAVLPVLEELGAWRSVVRGRWALVLANVQCGDLDQAEEELERARAAGADDVTAVLGFDQAIQAEIQLARGELDAGLAAWRQLTERLRTARDREVFGMERWTWEAHVVTVVAHAHAGRLRLVEPLVTGLPELLDRVEGVTFRGAVLLALGLVELDRGDSAAGARMIALAERLRYLRTFKPTMSVEQAQKAAIRANRPAYEAAVASYAGLSREELLALEQSARPQVAE